MNLGIYIWKRGFSEICRIYVESLGLQQRFDQRRGLFRRFFLD